MKLDVGAVVKISDMLDHDSGYCGQIGVVCKYCGYFDAEDYYYVVAWDSMRFWECGFKGSEVKYLGFKLDGLIDAYAMCLSNDCWRNTDHAAFKKFMKSLKTIRCNYREIVKERMR